ncbi:hypothetical protein DWZ92_10455 [Phocaeicola vulgatus]|nr:hypothetical protein DWZ92_10455 [Phocaeicola vulgatus]
MQQNIIKIPPLHISIDKIGKHNKYLIYSMFYYFYFLLCDYIFRIERLYLIRFQNLQTIQLSPTPGKQVRLEKS